MKRRAFLRFLGLAPIVGQELVNAAVAEALAPPAGVFAWAKRPEVWGIEFDYGGRVGFAIGQSAPWLHAVFTDPTDDRPITLASALPPDAPGA